MDLDELQSVQSRERQTDSLQQLRATFYQDAADFIQRLEDERDRAAERADDPWNAPEVGRLNDDIDTATQTVEAIYERRVGKIVKMASLAAADMPTDDDGLTEEEQALFETLVAAIEDNRESVFAILDGESPVDSSESSGASQSTPSAGNGAAQPPENDRPAHPDPEDLRVGDADAEPAPGSEEGIDAADLMGDESGAEAEDPGSHTNAGDVPESAAGEPAPDHEAGDGRPDVAAGTDRSAPDGGTRSIDPDQNGADGRSTDPAQDGGTTRSTGVDTASGSAVGHTGEANTPDHGGSVDRATVKITDDVGQIFGVDERSYDLTADDVVVLPEANADPLVDRGAAERLD